MKINAAMKDVMIDKIKEGLLTKMSSDDFNTIFSGLNNYSMTSKLFPYRLFKDYAKEDSKVPLVFKKDNMDDLDMAFLSYLNAITSNVVSSFDKGRKLAKVLKDIQRCYGSQLPFSLNHSSVLVVLLSLFLSEDVILDDIKYAVMETKLYYLKKYLLLLFYIDKLKLRDINNDAIIVEFLKRDKFTILDIDLGVFSDAK